MWTLIWSKIILNTKNDNLENGSLKPEYPFKKTLLVVYSWIQTIIFSFWWVVPLHALQSFLKLSFPNRKQYYLCTFFLPDWWRGSSLFCSVFLFSFMHRRDKSSLSRLERKVWLWPFTLHSILYMHLLIVERIGLQWKICLLPLLLFILVGRQHQLTVGDWLVMIGLIYLLHIITNN